jgi:hypothetical protein
MFRQDHRHLTALLVRPGDTKERVELTGSAERLAWASASAARCRVPTDAAIWIAYEALQTAPAATKEFCLGLTVSTTPSVRDAGLQLWVRQLRAGSAFTSDTLPLMWSPTRLRLSEYPAAVDAALDLAADPANLRAILDAECAAAAAGLTLSAAAAEFSWPAGTADPASGRQCSQTRRPAPR